jgi:uncharacterized protein (TIGR02217 family)
MAFLNDFIFPTDISINSSGGPKWATEVSINDSGYERRNQPWAYPLHDYDVAWGIKDITDLERLISAFHAAKAMLHAFRFRDPLDWKSCSRNSTAAYDDQVILASATGGEETLQLYKTYIYGNSSMERRITRPFDFVKLGINSVEKTENTHYTVDYETGLIDLTAGSSPHGALTATDEVTAGFHFHVPVRFNTNRLPIQLREYELGSARVPLVEVRE